MKLLNLTLLCYAFYNIVVYVCISENALKFLCHFQVTPSSALIKRKKEKRLRMCQKEPEAVCAPGGSSNVLSAPGLPSW